jgi:hypothetical protein
MIFELNCCTLVNGFFFAIFILGLFPTSLNLIFSELFVWVLLVWKKRFERPNERKYIKSKIGPKKHLVKLQRKSNENSKWQSLLDFISTITFSSRN